MGKRKDLDLYRLNESGGKLRYEYKGAWMVPPVPPHLLARAKILLTLCCALQAILVFLMGRLDFPSFRKLYVIIPFLAVLFFAGKSVIAAGMLFTWKDRMTFRQYQLSWRSLTGVSLPGAVSGSLLMMSVLADTIFLGGLIHKEWPLLLLILLQAALSAGLYSYLKRTSCLTRPNLGTDGESGVQETIAEKSE